MTFLKACLGSGLIDDDEEWSRAMQEAVHWMMPGSIRLLFVRILIHCQPVYLDELWENFKDVLSEDFPRLYGDHARAYNLAYFNICETLIAEGYDIANFPSVHIEDSNELHDNLADMGNRQYNMLNRDQKGNVDKILRVLNVIDYNCSRCFYIDGPGGSGIMFVYTKLYNLSKRQSKNVCCIAFTGIATTLLPKEMTAHKVRGLSVPLLSDSSSNIAVQSKEGTFFRQIYLFGLRHQWLRDIP